MKILVVTGSPRKNGNTEIMAEAFGSATEQNGHQVTIRRLSALHVAPCLGCKYCFSHNGVCAQKDDMNQLLDDLEQTDLLVLASPIYWFDISAQTKCFIDRMYAFACKGFHVSAIAMLLNSGAAGVYGAAEAQLNAISSYLKWENKGAVEVPGMAEKGSMHDSEGLQRVRDFAKSL